ncbi:MAG TPA: branched-chain amino acid ABC transporter permease/ATP-binding protein [Acidimicrobiales bacterium]|nr:branched-chain amino acid ABC transporter permease/ATP-binding protein [Acidimicrobiales bacterium]
MFWQDLLPFIVIGVTTGAVYGLAGTGVVLTYKTSGIFNFAFGALGALAVFIFYFLHDQHNWPWPLAAALVLVVIAPIGGLGLELLARSLEDASDTLKVVATVGLILMIIGIGMLWYGGTVAGFPQYLPSSTVRFLGVNVAWYQIIVIIISVVATAVLYYFFRFVRMGVAMRGVVDNPDLVAMTGESPIRVRRWAWVISTVFAAMAGLLLAPSLPLDALIITLLVVPAFGAAAIGYFNNLPLTFLGGILIGIAGSISSKYVVSIPWLSGFPTGLPFIVLFVVLCVTPRARLISRRVIHTLPVRKPWYAPPRVRGVIFAVFLAFMCLVPNFAGDQLSVWSNGLVEIILILSLGLLVRTAGLISLCQYAFAAIGAAAFSHFTVDYHVPWLLAVLLGVLIAVPVGALVAIPAVRLSGVFLGLATLGFGIFLEQMMYTTGIMFGPTSNGIPAPRPDASLGFWHFGTDRGFYFVLLVSTVLVVALIMAIQGGRMGRLLGGLSDSPTALETYGATTNVIRVMVFCVSAAIAAFSGILYASLFHYSVGGNYASYASLILVVLVVITIGGVPWYAIMAGILFTLFPAYGIWPLSLWISFLKPSSSLTTWLSISFGFFAATYAVFESKQAGVPLGLRNFLDRIGGRAPEPEIGATEVAAAVSTATAAEEAAAAADRELVAAPTAAVVAKRSGLEVEHLVVHFGGVRAVEDVSLNAPMGRITGLVGPNGAGKTTTFNVCSGLVKPTGGRVILHGGDVTKLGTSGRSRMGLGRTFQRSELFNSLTVRENVVLGREASMAGGNPLTQLFSRRGEKAQVKGAADEAIALTGLGPLASLQAGLLPTGQRRLVELARALAGPFDLLLLDEPSAGLNAAETERFGDILTGVVRERGMGILLVEHDMSLVRQVCTHIYVLDFGKLIFEGNAQEMLASEVVRAAYLGSEGEGGPEDEVLADPDGAVAVGETAGTQPELT